MNKIVGDLIIKSVNVKLRAEFISNDLPSSAPTRNLKCILK